MIQKISVGHGPVVEAGEASAVTRLAKAVNLFREMDNTMPSQVISVFLEVASSHHGVETRSLPERVGLSQASVSRAILYLAEADWVGKNKPGLRLVTSRVSRKDARQRIVTLTPKGRSLARQIERVLST